MSGAQMMMQGRQPAVGGPLFEDNWTGTNGAAWNTGKWTTKFANGTTTLVINSNRGRILTGSSGYTTGRSQATMSSVANVDVLLAVDTTDLSTNEGYPRVHLRASDGTTEIPANCYEFLILNQSSQAQIRKRVGGTETTLGTVAWTRNVGLNWWRMQCQGTTIRHRIWADGASEPGTWLQSFTDSSTASGVVSVGFTGNGVRTIYYDNITVEAL